MTHNPRFTPNQQAVFVKNGFYSALFVSYSFDFKEIFVILRPIV